MWTATQDDELLDSHTINLRGAWVNCRSTSVPYFVQCGSGVVNELYVYVFNAAGALNDAAGVEFDVFAI